MRLLKERTGHDLDVWIERVQAEGLPDTRGKRAWLTAQGLSTNYAAWVAERAEGRKSMETYDPVGLVEGQFEGPRSSLRPVYERVLATALAIAPDVKACPGQTIVPLYRNHVFAQIKATTTSRLDVGFALGDTPCEAPLIDTGGFAKKDRITHRLPLAAVEDVDDALEYWLRVAYDRDA